MVFHLCKLEDMSSHFSMTIACCTCCDEVSPDSSSIEHQVFDEAEILFENFQNEPATLAEMGPALRWIVQHPPGSTRHRCQACINANGGQTEY